MGDRRLSRLPGHKGRMGDHKGRMGDHKGRMGDHKGRMGDHKGRMGDHKGRMGDHKGRMGDHKGRMGDHKGRMGDHKGRMGDHKGRPYGVDIFSGCFSSSGSGASTLSALPFFLVKATSSIQTGMTIRATTIRRKSTLAWKRSSKYIRVSFWW
jgi:hypothetical protein